MIPDVPGSITKALAKVEYKTQQAVKVNGNIISRYLYLMYSNKPPPYNKPLFK